MSEQMAVCGARITDDGLVLIFAKDGDREEELGLFFASLGDGEVPSELQVFPYGRVEMEGADPFVVDDAAMNDVIAEFKARGIDMVFDYEHQTEGGEFSSPDGKAPAAGWVKAFINKGKQGLWAAVDWTESARALIAKKEYRYYSPVFSVTKAGRRLASVKRLALTNAPRLNWIRPIVAKEGKDASRSAPTGTGGPRTAPTREDQGMEFLRLCAKLLGLPDDATEDQVVAALKALQGKAVDGGRPAIAKDVLTALDLPETANQSEVVASIHALKQKPDLTQEVASLKSRLAERDRDDLVVAAIKQGKITPAQKEWAEGYALRDPEGFKVFVAKTPQIVPLDKVKLTEDPRPAGQLINETVLQVAKMMGNTKEDLEKYAGR